MKQLILILHMLSGSTLEVSAPKDIEQLNNLFTKEPDSFYEKRMGLAVPYYAHHMSTCYIASKGINLRLGYIEYLEEKYIELADNDKKTMDTDRSKKAR